MKTVRMYLLRREGRDDDYIMMLDNGIEVHSELFKSLWMDPNKINYNMFNFNYTLETYYGYSNVLDNAELLWEHVIE